MLHLVAEGFAANAVGVIYNGIDLGPAPGPDERASIDYRLTAVARHPAQVNDCCSAIRWLRANAARYNLDPTRRGFGYGVDGAMTEYVKVPSRCLHRVPDGLALDRACLTEPCCVARTSVKA